MGVNSKQRSRVTFYNLSVISSPGGDGVESLSRQRRLQALYGASFTAYLEHEYPIIASSDAEPFNGSNLCWQCGVAFDADAHRSFVFYLSPIEIQHASTTGGVPSQWRPCPENLAIPGDRGPGRVAYWYNNGPVVQVHDGDDCGFWVPCDSYTVTRAGLPYNMWVCRRHNVTDPCDAEYLRSISS